MNNGETKEKGWVVRDKEWRWRRNRERSKEEYGEGEGLGRCIGGMEVG